MPDLANLLHSQPSPSPALANFPEVKPVSDANLVGRLESDPEQDMGRTQLTESIDDGRGEGIQDLEECEGGGIGGALSPCRVGPTTAKNVQDWRKRKIEEGVPEFKCYLPFLVGAAPLAQCSFCQNGVYPEEKILCSVRGCQGVFHLRCAREGLGFSSSKQFKCPQHACFLCKQKHHLWRCIRCPIASHDKCAPFPEHVFHFPDRPGEAICWRHPTDWRLEKKETSSDGLNGSIC